MTKQKACNNPSSISPLCLFASLVVHDCKSLFLPVQAQPCWCCWIPGSVFSVCESMPQVARATCTLAGCCSPSCPASAATPLHHYYSGPVLASQSFPCASCCAGCTRQPSAWHRRAGTVPPGRQTSPWTLGWDVRAGLRFCTERSPDPWSWAESASRMYLQKTTTLSWDTW